MLNGDRFRSGGRMLPILTDVRPCESAPGSVPAAAAAATAAAAPPPTGLGKAPEEGAGGPPKDLGLRCAADCSRASAACCCCLDVGKGGCCCTEPGAGCSPVCWLRCSSSRFCDKMLVAGLGLPVALAAALLASAAEAAD